MSDRKNVLITGGAGYIGSHVVLCCLLSKKYRVVTIDNYHNSFPEAIKRVSQIARSELGDSASEEDKAACEVDVQKGDITNPKDIDAIFESYKSKGGIWGLIHVAAHKAVGESGEKPIQYYRNNINATVNLMDACDRYGARHIVYSSSATVYGAPTTIPIPETTPLVAESCYGRTKVMSEMILKDICDSDPSSWRCIALRYFNPAGAHPSGMIGEDPRGRPGNLLPLLAQMAVGKVDASKLEVFGNDYPTPDGTCVRDYIHVMDLAQGHIDALNALDKDEIFVQKQSSGGFGGSGGKFKAYNLGKGKGMSVLNMIEAMHVASGFDYKYKIVARRIGDVPDLTADPALAEKELGFLAKNDLKTMCRDQWNWQSKNPKGYETSA